MPEAQFEHVKNISVSHHTLKAASQGKKGSCAEKLVIFMVVDTE
jgi:hypothetical protein